MSFSEQRTESTVVELCRDLRKLEQEVGELRRQVAAHENELGRLLKAAGSRRSSRTSEVDQRLARVLELLRSGGTWMASEIKRGAKIPPSAWRVVCAKLVQEPGVRVTGSLGTTRYEFVKPLP